MIKLILLLPLCLSMPKKDPLPKSAFSKFTKKQVLSYKSKEVDKGTLAKIVSEFSSEKVQKILDIGCGDGELTSLIATGLLNKKVIGCDPSSSMIEYANKHFSSENTSFICQDAEQLKLTQQFDAIVSNNSLHWVKNQKRVLKKVYEHLSPGGKTFLIATPKSSINDLKTVCKKVILSKKWLLSFFTFRSTHSFYTKKEYEKMLLHAGFINTEISIHKACSSFRDKNHLFTFLSAVLTPLTHLKEIDRPEFLNDIFF